MAGSVCLVTIHGIGFQQPPKDGHPGYADALHEHLRQPLGDRLGEDPHRPGAGGPVYVSSEWNGSPAEGLARLDQRQELVGEEGQIAHVALVYSPSEPLEPRLGETAEALARAAISHGHYTSALGALRLLLSDAWAAAHEDSGGDPRSTLTPRSDIDPPVHHGLLARIRHRGAQATTGEPAAAGPSAPGAFGTLRALQDDIATYVTRNDLRERVRDFVQDALLLLIARDDISAVVINAHSQGTVLSWDVLCRLPFSSWEGERAGLFRHFVTAGSPIRKYVDMFAWGDHVGELAAVLEPAGSLTWSNFCDPHDPVGDPLNPPVDWRPGDPWDKPTQPDGGLLVARGADGTLRHVSIADCQVDNTKYSSGGGLQAHDYWNNEKEFVSALAKLL
ncbi:MAG: hypothetical protein M3Z06_07585 [Actinomycetota bacterium]|nr:hypothetical protein [Actinomycetota bacterium]